MNPEQITDRRRRAMRDIEVFIEQNFKLLSNTEIASALGLKLSRIRSICYKLGLKRMELEYFTIAQINYLKKHYQIKGDAELADLFQQKWPKNKGWTNKHIEKKRKYLGLHRTSEQIAAIRSRNIKKGRFSQCPVKAWDKRGRAPEGEIRYWTYIKTGKSYPVIKSKGVFMHWARWAWQNNYGPIPTGKKIVFRDGDPYNRSLSNLVLLSHAELAQRNAKKSSQGLSDNYIAGLLSHRDRGLRETIKLNPRLLDVKRKQLTLNRIIYEQQNLS